MAWLSLSNEAHAVQIALIEGSLGGLLPEIRNSARQSVFEPEIRQEESELTEVPRAVSRSMINFPHKHDTRFGVVSTFCVHDLALTVVCCRWHQHWLSDI